MAEVRHEEPADRRLFGIEYPIFAFSHCRDVVAAVTNAGGMGVLGALAFSPEQLEMELNWIDEHVGGKPYGVDVVMPVKTVDRDAGIDDTERHGRPAREMIPQEHWDYVDKMLAEQASTCRSTPSWSRRRHGCRRARLDRRPPAPPRSRSRSSHAIALLANAWARRPRTPSTRPTSRA